MKLSRACEDYLKAILILEQNGPVRSVEIADMMQVSRPSVCSAVKLLRERGLITMDAEKRIILTDAGRAIAERIFELNRVRRQILLSIGLDSETAEEDACGMEHVVSAETLEKLKSYFAAHRREEGEG